MLEKNFDGRRFTVKSKDETPIDCMFFPFNDEKVVTKTEMEASHTVANADQDIEKDPKSSKSPVSRPEYLKYPTIIFFNPNA